MRLKEILEKKATSKKTKVQEKELIQKLIAKANEIIELSSAQLGHVSDVFKEFDKHNKEHSEGVLEIIEDLLGSKAEKLSSHDLFALIAVSYLHDCGMAVSDYEMEVLKMVEGKLDGQKPVKKEEAKRLIVDNLNKIYGPKCSGFNDTEIQDWIFVPADEDTLIDDFAELLTDYQDYRNGRIDEIKASDEASKAIEDQIKANEVKIKTNNKIRIDYLRITHHLRIEKYIKNWGKTKYLKDFPIIGMGQQIANDIAACCKAHGEDDSFLNQLKQKNYSDGETTNLQFVAMMLRLGDILHFSYDRAHPALRALHHFQSEYSYNQWRLKADNGLKFIVKNGKISCRAYCELARDYYDILNYVKAVDHELALYNTLSPKWNDFPKIIIKDKVNLDDLDYNKEKFQPVPGLKFSLDQNKVLDLLMGAKLYTNEYACLRELYQNSLDACRCQIEKAQNSIPKGVIEFGLGEEKRNGKKRKYVYCLDNGKGMSKDIIEKYLLHIGSSYYRSSDFFKKKAETGLTFTPTSQFGIGMLSCFMIGDEIEITTHEEGSNDGVISCVMEGPNEYFYYKLPSKEDAEKVPNSGTLVKVFLKEKYQKLLNDDPLDELGYLLWSIRIDENKEKWDNHLYQIVNDFIVVVPRDIEVFVSLQNINGGKKLAIKIYSKPLSISGDLKDYVNINHRIDENEVSKLDEYQKTDSLYIKVEENGLECRTMIFIGRNYFGSQLSIFGVTDGTEICCVDGIKIDRINIIKSLMDDLTRIGILNFIGENRPQLSVSRDSIIESSLEKYDHDAEVLMKKLITESITQVCIYINKTDILQDQLRYDSLWEKLFDKFTFCCGLFYQCLKEHTSCHEMKLPINVFSKILTFKDLLIADETIISKNVWEKCGDSLRILLLLRLLCSNSVLFKSESEILLEGHKDLPSFILFDLEKYDLDNYLLLCPNGFDKIWPGYDLVSFTDNLCISERFMQHLCGCLKSVLRSGSENGYVIQDNWVYSEELRYIKWLYREIERQIEKLILLIKDNHLFDFIVDDSIDNELAEFIISSHESGANCIIKYIGLTVYIHDFSVLAFSDSKSDNSICFARRGRCTRQELLDSISEGWKDKIKNVLFLDGTIWNPDSSN